MRTYLKIAKSLKAVQKRCCLCLSLVVLAAQLLAQSDGSIKLSWKIAPQDTLIYKTDMSEIDTSDTDKRDIDANNANKRDIDANNADKTAENAPTKSDSCRKFFEALSSLSEEAEKNTMLVSKLTRQKRDIIGITICIQKNERAKAATRAYYDGLFKDIIEKGKKAAVADSIGEDALKNIDDDFKNVYDLADQDQVLLEGAVYDKGAIHSFYLPISTKNDLALFFELPTKRLKIGDTWALNVQFSNINGEFTCDSFFRKNQVQLVDIKKEAEDSIAVLAYDIQEFVSGNAPFSTEKTIYQTTYKAVAEFSITKGRWRSYKGELFTNTSYRSGMMKSGTSGSFVTNAVTKKYQLTPIDK